MGGPDKRQQRQEEILSEGSTNGKHVAKAEAVFGLWR